MIVLNSRQLDGFDYNKKSQRSSTSFNSQLTNTPNTTDTISRQKETDGPYSADSFPQKTANQTLQLVVEKKIQTTEPIFIKPSTSFSASFAIKQYEAFANIDAQQKKSSMLGINEFV